MIKKQDKIRTVDYVQSRPQDIFIVCDSNFYLPCLPKILWYIFVNVVAISCYVNSLWCDLVHDDLFAITENQDLRPETPIRRAFLNDFWGKPMSSNTSHKSYRPICVLTFRLNYFMHGLDPFGYHAVNVSLHAIVCSIFLYTCEKFMLKSFNLAVIAALLFASHPVHTEAVTGVVGRADVLAGMFFLLAFWAYVRGAEATSKNSSLGNALCLVMCICLGSAAMLVKEHGVTVFGLCAVYDVFVLNKDIVNGLLNKRRFGIILKLPKDLAVRLIVISVVVLALMAFRIWMLNGQLPNFSKQDNPASFADSIITRSMTYCYLFAFNVWLLLTPSVLCYDWQMGSISLVESFLDVRNLATASFFVVLVVLVFLATFSTVFPTGEQNQLTLGLAMIVIPFLPASNMFFKVGFVVAERILYIPSMGFCVIIAIGLNKLASIGNAHHRFLDPAVIDSKGTSEQKVEQRENFLSKLVTVLTFLLILLFCWKTITRNTVWRSRESLFISGVQTLPNNGKVHYNYANFLKDSGRLKEAEIHYRRTLELVPDHVSAHNNLGTLLKDHKEAEKHYLLALKYDPYHANSYLNLGSHYGEIGKLEEAETMLRQATKLSPNNMDALLNLANVVYKQGDMVEAEDIYERVLQHPPVKADSYNNYGVFLVNTGRAAEAVSKYERAVQLNPQHHVAFVNLGRALRSLGRNEEAISAYKSGLAVKREATTLHLLGVVYYHNNQLHEAETTWKECLNLDPKDAQTRSNLAVLFAKTGRPGQGLVLLQELVQDQPQNPAHLKNLVSVLAQMGKTDRALVLINQALAVSPLAELFYEKGNLLQKLNKIKEAGNSFREAVRRDPNHHGAQMNLGVVLHMEGSYSQARKHYEAALKLNPNGDNSVLLENLRKLSRAEQKQKSPEL